MGAFEYTAVDTAGKERRGILEGDTARQVRQLLREKQLLPLEVSEIARQEASRRTSTPTAIARTAPITGSRRCSPGSASTPIAGSRTFRRA